MTRNVCVRQQSVILLKASPSVAIRLFIQLFYRLISPLSTIVTFDFGVPEPVPAASILVTTSSPSMTLPKTTWRPSNHGVYIWMDFHPKQRIRVRNVHKDKFSVFFNNSKRTTIVVMKN